MFLSFQLGHSRHIRKISFFQHVGGGKGDNGELCNVLCGLIATGVSVRKYKGNDTQMWRCGLFRYWDYFHLIWIGVPPLMVESRLSWRCFSSHQVSLDSHKILEFAYFGRLYVVVYWNSCSRIVCYNLCIFIACVLGCFYMLWFFFSWRIEDTDLD